MDKKWWYLSLLLLLATSLSAQRQEMLELKGFKNRPVKTYSLLDKQYDYPKPRIYTAFQLIPRTYAGVGKELVSKKGLKGIGIVLASSALVIALDQGITDKVQQFSRHIGLDNSLKTKNLISFNIGSQNFDVYQAPQNLNTAIYSIGEGVPPLLIAAGLAIHGMAKKDYRSLSTSSQIMQAIISFGITSQLLKRSFGRETPRVATQSGGVWRPFPAWGKYQKDVSKYDAVPSGHLGTMMATLVVLADNYPEKKYIKPVGYSLIGLVALSMINNGVHWAGDYPLALGLGYVFGKVTVKTNRLLNKRPR